MLADESLPKWLAYAGSLLADFAHKELLESSYLRGVVFDFICIR